MVYVRNTEQLRNSALGRPSLKESYLGNIVIRLEHSGTYSKERQCDHPAGKHFIKDAGSQATRKKGVNEVIR